MRAARARMSSSPITINHLFYRNADRDYATEDHAHSAHQWYCVVEGDVETVVSGVPLRLSDAKSVVISPGVMRAPRCCGRAPSYIVATFENHGLLLAPIAERALDMPAELRPDLMSLVAELREPGGSDADELCKALVIRMLIGLGRAQQPRPHARGAETVVSRLEAFMLANLHRSLTRHDLAAAVHLSPPHVARLYRNASGKTLGRRLTELRIERARSLLGNSTSRVSQIASDVGFNSLSHFTKVFKRETGVLPSVLRRSQ
jgi:AraC family transcriptional regulator of arabinose operon